MKINPFSHFLLISLGAMPAGACPVCQTETGRRVREGIFSGADLGPNLAATALPFLIFLGIAALVHSGPRRRAGTPSGRAGDE